MDKKLQNKVLVFDCNSFLFRWINSRHDFFTDMLQAMYSVIRSFKPYDVYFCFDRYGSNYRKSILPEYKQNREEIKENDREKYEFLYLQLDKVYYYLQEQGEKVLRFEGIESDDLMAYIALNENDVIILSEDYDLLQLPCINYSLKKHKILDLQEIYQCNQPTFILAKAIAGDTGDNISGLRGLGIKTSVKIIKQCNLTDKEVVKGTYNLDIFYSRLEEVKRGKRVEAILNNREIIERNLKLVDLISYNDEIVKPIKEELEEILNR